MAGEQHIQKAWDGLITANYKSLVLSGASSDVHKARLLSSPLQATCTTNYCSKTDALGWRCQGDSGSQTGLQCIQASYMCMWKGSGLRGLHGLFRTKTTTTLEPLEWHAVDLESNQASTNSSSQEASQPAVWGQQEALWINSPTIGQREATGSDKYATMCSTHIF